MSALLRHASRFVVVGVLNTGVYYGVYLLLNRVLPYLPAHVLAILVAMVGSFFLNTYWTFRTRPTWKKFALFPLTNLANYVIQTVGLVFAVETLGIDDDLAPLVTAVVAIPITFFLTRKILHRPDPGGRASAVFRGTA